ncbi:lipoprotein-releasing ABC transporter ATP-binding protein LolD [Legionella sp. W05-934-2]|jgi:lipoprotein-releasing system ATP-binding protein|uniref:lipoprotein-releasing ABC transporter ATP-binding protein LolD n=1 Tax=Legionella sp. W05-934-2 TaxID=1198649 RepID=UPI0034636E09
MSNTILTCTGLEKSYHDGRYEVSVLRGIDLTISKGERIAIVGPSGSGKSTLLHLLGGLDNPTGGEIAIFGKKWQALSEKKRCQQRNRHLGFIYQFHHLLPELSALDNIAIPQVIAGKSVKDSQQLANQILTEVGLSHRIDHKPSQLSGGERQRVAIARALINQPACVLADEPTGNLDHATATKVFDKLLALNETHNTALVIVTHDKSLAQKMDRVLTLVDGIIKEYND